MQTAAAALGPSLFMSLHAGRPVPFLLTAMKAEALPRNARIGMRSCMMDMTDGEETYRNEALNFLLISLFGC